MKERKKKRNLSNILTSVKFYLPSTQHNTHHEENEFLSLVTKYPCPFPTSAYEDGKEAYDGTKHARDLIGAALQDRVRSIDPHDCEAGRVLPSRIYHAFSRTFFFFSVSLRATLDQSRTPQKVPAS